MRTNEIQFNGKTYVCRIVEANDGEELLVAPTTLLDTLQPGSCNDDNEGFASKEAESIYDGIFSSPMKEPFCCLKTSWLTNSKRTIPIGSSELWNNNL